ncbi:MAG: trypsin-like serine protease [Bdellovibrionales bacterium]|nr:trypsin-like serine protease [Bdellovibrionales bacterium]
MVRIFRIILLLGFITTFFTACSKSSEDILSQNQNSSTKIVDGHVASISDYASKVTVLLYDSNNKGVCTGALLSPYLVITAAHCVDDSSRDSLTVVFHQNNSSFENEKFARVNKIIVHERYDAGKEEDGNDIALVMLKDSAPGTYEGVKLLTDVSVINENSLILVAGFGRYNSAAAGDLKLRWGYSKVESNTVYSKEILLDQSFYSGVCKGDSGGPVFVKSNNTWYYLGVISSALYSRNSKDFCKETALITKASAYYDWMLGVLKSL